MKSIAAILPFCIFAHFTIPLPLDLITVSIRYWNEGFYFLLHTKAGFSTFYIELLVTLAASTGVNLLSMFSPHTHGKKTLLTL